MALLASLMLVGLSACGEATTSSSAPAATATTAPADGSTGSAADATPATSDGGSTGASTELKTGLVEWSVNLSQSEVPAGKVQFVTTNQGTFKHNAVVLQGGTVLGRTPNFTSAEGPQIFEVDLKPGEYQVICDIPGHPEQGMKTTLVVK